MTQLWAWKYEGQDEVGERFYRGHDEFCRTFNNKERYRLLVTNLRKVKVVDEDAITISKAEVDEITSMTIQTKPQSCAEEAIGFYRAKDTILRILRHSVVTEPKNFGAIVEAETASWRTRRKFVKLVGVDGATWFDEEQRGCFVWVDLINPTIISEGVE